MTPEEIERIAAKVPAANVRMIRAITKGIAEILGPEIVALRQRIDDLERGGIRYCGVYQAAQSYKRGELVTHDGSMWHANRDTDAAPGDGKDWSLCVKKGRDARGA